MEITIELDDEGIQQQIKNELDYFLIIAEAMELHLSISRILVPIDFQAKVRELTGDDDYKFQRGSDDGKITVAAKILEDKDGLVIVISPFLYLPIFDTMIRSFILTHEFTHILNKNRFPEIPKGSFVRENYLTNLYFSLMSMLLTDFPFISRSGFLIHPQRLGNNSTMMEVLVMSTSQT